MKVIYVNDTLKNVSDLTDSDRQTVAEKLVSREIHCCVSQMISELSNDPNGTYIDRILEFSCQPEELDAMEAANGDSWYSYEQLKENADFYSEEFQSDLKTTIEAFDLVLEDKELYYYEIGCASGLIVDINSSSEDWEDLCDQESISLDSEDYREAFEHWIVSDWLADKLLLEYGELVTLGFLGLTLWGRTCTGQAIYLDHVIQEIAINSYSFYKKD